MMQIARRQLVLGVTSVALLASGAARAAPPGRWISGAPIPEGANEVVGAAVGGKIIVYGGLSAFAPLSLCWLYDPATNAWKRLPPHPAPAHHCAAVGVGDRFFLFGGFEKPVDGPPSWAPVARAWMLDLRSERWIALAPMPTARGALTATAVGDKIYAIGGSIIPKGVKRSGLTLAWGGEQTNINEVFDIATGRWSTAAPMLSGRNHAAAGASGGKIYVIGGRVGSAFVGAANNVSINEAYDVASDQWAPAAMMPTPRSGLESAVVAGRLHLLGGEGYLYGLQGTSNVHEVYDPAANSWAIYPPMQARRHGFAIAVVDDRIYAITGSDVAGNGGGPATGVTANEIFVSEK